LPSGRIVGRRLSGFFLKFLLPYLLS
jgi:hypothetical protein